MSVSYDFSSRVAFVTGAASGMGAATARAFAASGAAVVIADRDESAVGALVDELRSAGGEVLGVTVDVTDEQSVARAVAATVERFGRLDFAFNNAGIMPPVADAAEEDADVHDQVTAVNLRGVWASMKHELAQMREQGSGAIVNCSSIGGLVGGDGRASYHATKHAVIGLTKSVALQYGRRGIRVNAVCPGTIDTPMVDRMVAEGQLDRDASTAGTPLRRLGRPEEIAASVLWLCSEGSSYVTGVALPVDGGLAAQ